MDIETLQRFCYRADPKFPRADLERPFYTELAGKVWTAASDGHRMIATARVVPGAASGVKIGIHEVIADALKLPVRPVSRGAFASVTPGPELVIPACTSCKGTPPPAKSCRSCRGDGVCSHCDNGDCPDCDGLGETWGCQRCDSTGREPIGERGKDPTPIVVLDGICFNARYVREAVDALDGDLAASVPVDMEPWTLRGANGMAVVMPMRASDGEIPSDGRIELFPTIAKIQSAQKGGG